MEAPRRMKFEDHRKIASEVGEESGEFYCVAAERIPLKFKKPSARTHSQTASPTGQSHWSKPYKDFV